MAAEPADAPQTIFEKLKGTINWADLLTDHAPGSISASNMLGIDGDSVTNVENVRDVVVAVKGLTSNGSNAIFGLSITPARTSLSPMDLSTYASGALWRLLGSTTFGYAQGDATIEGKDFERRAMSIETSFFWHAADGQAPAARPRRVRLDDVGLGGRCPGPDPARRLGRPRAR